MTRKFLIGGGIAAAIASLATVAMSQPAQTATSWAGTYRGQFDGGNGSVKISPAKTGSYKVALSVVGGDGCAGEASGSGAPVGAQLNLDLRNDYGACVVHLTKRQGRLQLQEEGDCTAFHGASCGFVGSAAKVR